MTGKYVIPTNKDAKLAISGLAFFRNRKATLSGGFHRDIPSYLGRLDTEAFRELVEAFNNKDRDASVYIVRSYSTPIAWCDANGEWHIPRVSYTPTTTRHQSIVRMAVNA